MEIIQFILLSLLFTTPFSLAFTPQDNYLINCGGSNVGPFVGDYEGSGFLSGSQTESLTDQYPSQNLSLLYKTVRVFTKEINYKFGIQRRGLHMVRFHFFPFLAQRYNLTAAEFHVSANGASLLRDFGPARNKSVNSVVVIKEFTIRVDHEKLAVTFKPVSGSGVGFVNAIEVFSVPNDLFPLQEVITLGPNGTKDYEVESSFPVLEMVHRINVGGKKITPRNDTLWRTWLPDEDFLVFKPAAKNVSRSSSPVYQDGGASREIAPDNVYMTAQEMNTSNMSLNNNFNITWKLSLSSDNGTYLVRMHFCDIVSKSPNQLYFKAYVNDYLAYDVDLSRLTHRLASPYYLDFIVESGNTMRISVGPSGPTSSTQPNAILNGLEIMKMVNVKSLFPHSRSSPKYIGVVVGLAVGGFVLLCVVLWMKCRNKKPLEPESSLPLQRQGGSSDGKVSQRTYSSAFPERNFSSKISFEDIEHATDNFGKDNIIGRGGFGTVYRGKLRDQEVAVKRGDQTAAQGFQEFLSEITLLSKIRHRHLVSLVGYCDENSEMILVYEFVQKGTLRSHLYAPHESSSHFYYPHESPLSWEQRLNICVGAARGLHYLHTGAQIIHRDVKSTNILLDENYVAKVSDFGLSRSDPSVSGTQLTGDEPTTSPHLKREASIGVKGSFGYFDPEHINGLPLTYKSDVYSFGVVLLEVLCARPAIFSSEDSKNSVENLAEWAIPLLKDSLKEIMDPKLLNAELKSLNKFGDTVVECLAKNGSKRPDMEVVLSNLVECQRLQKTIGRPREPHEGSTAPTVVPPSIELDSSYGSTNTGQVFSQLTTSEGR